MSEFIQVAQADGVCTITLNRADKYNSFVREMALALQTELTRANEDKTVRCIVLTGNGKAFCAGQDLAEAVDPNGPNLSRIVSEHYNPIITLIRDVDKPIIAAVNGVAAGAGANIALACDVVVATESAAFIQAFSKIGLIPDSGGTFTLPRLIGFQKASALMLLGDKISARDAESMNMIYAYFPDAEFADSVKALALKLAAMPTKGLALTKRALNRTYINNLDQQLALEDELQSQAGETYDYNEGVQAFLEKRKPVFKGE